MEEREDQTPTDVQNVFACTQNADSYFLMTCPYIYIMHRERIRRYDVEDVFELLNPTIRSSGSTVLLKFESKALAKKLRNLSLRKGKDGLKLTD